MTDASLTATFVGLMGAFAILMLLIYKGGKK